MPQLHEWLSLILQHCSPTAATVPSDNILLWSADCVMQLGHIILVCSTVYWLVYNAYCSRQSCKIPCAQYYCDGAMNQLWAWNRVITCKSAAPKIFKVSSLYTNSRTIIAVHGRGTLISVFHWFVGLCLFSAHQGIIHALINRKAITL